jgi:hypothetical protein
MADEDLRGGAVCLTPYTGRYPWNPLEWSSYHKVRARVITTNLTLSSLNCHKVEGPKLN